MTIELGMYPYCTAVPMCLGFGKEATIQMNNKQFIFKNMNGRLKRGYIFAPYYTFSGVDFRKNNEKILR